MNRGCAELATDTLSLDVGSVANPYWKVFDTAGDRAAYPQLLCPQYAQPSVEAFEKTYVVVIPVTARAEGDSESLGRAFPSEGAATTEPGCSSAWLSRMIELSLGQNQVEEAASLQTSPIEPTELVLLGESNGFPVSKEIVDFAKAHEISDHLRFAFGCIQTVFGRDAAVVSGRDEDPEFEDRWIVVTIRLQAEIPDILRKYDHLVDLWVEHVPTPQRSMIRFTFDVIE